MAIGSTGSLALGTCYACIAASAIASPWLLLKARGGRDSSRGSSSEEGRGGTGRAEGSGRDDDGERGETDLSAERWLLAIGALCYGPAALSCLLGSQGRVGGRWRGALQAAAFGLNGVGAAWLWVSQGSVITHCRLLLLLSFFCRFFGDFWWSVARYAGRQQRQNGGFVPDLLHGGYGGRKRAGVCALQGARV